MPELVPELEPPSLAMGGKGECGERAVRVASVELPVGAALA